MRRLAIAVSLAVLWATVSSCIVAPSPAKRNVVNVAVLMYPGGGAPPPVLALYKAALEVSKTANDYELRISNINPLMPEPGTVVDKQQAPPAVSALEQAMGQDPPPDVVLFSGIGEFNAALDKDLLQPLDTYVRSDKNVKPDDYYPGALEALSDNGRLYALPINVGPTVLMYDKRVLDDAGVPAPEPNWNWSAFVGYAKQLTKATGDPQNDRYAINLSVQMALPAFIWQNGGELVSKDGKRSLLNEPAAVEAVKFYSDLINTYKVVPPDPKANAGGPGYATKPALRVGQGEVAPLWSPMGRVAMMFASGAGGQMQFMPFMRGGQDRPIRLAELPRGKLPATILDVYTAIGMTSKAANSPVAYKAMMALASEMQKDLSSPARRSLAKNLRQINPGITEDDAQVILRSLEYARPMPWLKGGEGMRILYEKLFTPIQRNTKSIDEAIKDASDAIDEVLNK
ncbi:MAG: extracellular solute-binding protein [Chloroflexi bacterium]|nr:extracellular solute-binding protein [Chloroflexota bacterium]